MQLSKIFAWLILLGIGASVVVAVTIAVLVVSAALNGYVPTDYISSSASMQSWLRIAFLVIAIGTVCRFPTPSPARWRWAVAIALAVLSSAVVVELAGNLVGVGWIGDFGVDLGPADSLERRLFRLGAMASYAIPMLVLLAGAEVARIPGRETRHSNGRLSALLLKFEAPLFAVGASMLSVSLMAAAFVHREFTWLSAVGADASAAACVAAAIRARHRLDRLAFGGWAIVCIGMAVGLVMGIYAFDGPVPAPTFIGGYGDLTRMIVRYGHVILLTIGITGIALAGVFQSRGG